MSNSTRAYGQLTSAPSNHYVSRSAVAVEDPQPSPLRVFSRRHIKYIRLHRKGKNSYTLKWATGFRCVEPLTTLTELPCISSIAISQDLVVLDQAKSSSFHCGEGIKGKKNKLRYHRVRRKRYMHSSSYIY